jgi:hypothetical protein
MEASKMERLPAWLIAFGLSLGAASAQSFKADVALLVEASCIQCHDADTDTALNFEALDIDLADPESFLKWEKVFDRVRLGEMPPAKKKRPDPKQVKMALASLKKDLRSASLTRQQRVGRVPARRLTKLEFGYTLRDLLLIESDVTSGIPDEVQSGSFDTVGASQRISAVHMESYLKAADEALRLAIQLRRNPYRSQVNNYAFLNQFHDKPLNLGGNVTRKLKFGRGFVLFRDIDYLTQFQLGVTTPGIHRLTASVAAYQSKSPVTLKLIVKDPTGGARLVKMADLVPGNPETIVVDTLLKPGDTPYLTFDMEGVEPFVAIQSAGGARNYKGRGMAIMSQKAEGPLFDSWPPPSTRQILKGLELAKSKGGAFKVKSSKSGLEHVSDIVGNFAPRAFRRPPVAGELNAFIDLAKPAITEGRDLPDAVLLPLRSILSSPQFLLFDEKPGRLDDHALANRLSYFLWKSMPDAELFALAKKGKLSQKEVLTAQIERMLNDVKAERFVRDFLGQWLRLYYVNATTPDENLYPEYDELLGRVITKETELFFTELVKKNLGVSNLVDSEFTFVNSRLARHYGLKPVAGQHMRRVELPADSPRGGMLTQASVLKSTANGTTTSPVTRGIFVLSNLLGMPPAPPPPDVGSIEPDTRGKTTIREILAAHRNIETCAKCHREIDPPGFALESFDPIGRFRTKYRITRFRDGLPVDASGVTADGKKFSSIREFKKHLLAKNEQIARHFISRLVVYSTGGEIQFADREELDAIVDRTRDAGFPVRTIIHEVIKSKMFRNK